MAEEVRQFTVTIPASTPKTAPVTVAITMPVRVVTRVDWRVPNGPMGVFGWYLAMGGVPVMPQPAGTFVVANDETGSWDLTGQPDSGAWQVIGYNTGSNPHSVYLAVHVDLPSRTVQAPALLPAAMLGLAPDLSKAGPPL